MQFTLNAYVHQMSDYVMKGRQRPNRNAAQAQVKGMRLWCCRNLLQSCAIMVYTCRVAHPPWQEGKATENPNPRASKEEWKRKKQHHYLILSLHGICYC